MATQARSWQWTPLGEVLMEHKETPSLAELASGAVRIIAKIGFNDGKIQVRSDTKTRTSMILVRPGDLVVSGINAAKGAVAIYGEENSEPVAATIHYGAYAPKKERADARFLWWLLRSQVFREILNTNLPGGIKTELKAKRLLPIKVPLPSLDEQRRIVSRIEELAARVEEARDLRTEAAAQIDVLFSTASSRIFESVEGKPWPVVTLADVTGRITKGESPEWQGFTYQEEGPVFVRSENVLWGRLDISNAARIPVQFHQKLSRSQLKSGDVLINLVGASIGRAAVFTGEVREANVNQAVAVISSNADKLDSWYLMRFLNSGRTQQVIHGGKVETARPNISLGDLRVLRIQLPPVAEQRRIVAYLDDLQSKVDALKKLQSETAVELDALMPSILAKAFRAEL